MKKVTIESEMKRRMDLAYSLEFRKTCVEYAKAVGISAEEWEANKAVIVLYLANRICAEQNKMMK